MPNTEITRKGHEMDGHSEISDTSNGNTEQTSSKTTVIPTAVSSRNKPRSKGNKSTPLPLIERRNWLIHTHFVRKEYDTCKSLIKEQLRETKGQCEYAIYIQAMILRSEGEIQSSLELFQACHLLDPKNPDNLRQIARNLVLIGKHKSAIECYNQAADLSERDWNICHCLGVCHQFLQQYDKAIECYKEALAKNKHLVTYIALSKLFQEINDVDKAMDILKKGVDFAPENTELLSSLGLLYMKKNNFHRAFEYLGQVLTFDPENYQAILAVSSLMQKHGDFDVALNKYRVAAKSVPESSSVWNNIGMCYYGKKKIVPAISCLKRAHYHSAFDWKILYNLSLLHLNTEQFASAFQFASTAISLKPKHGPLFTLLAIALSKLGQEENAEKAYEQAMLLDSSDPYTVVNFLIFLNNRSQYQRAASLLTFFYSTNPQEKLAEMDKELSETCKKLAAALNVGTKVVAEKDKIAKSKKSTKEKVNVEDRKNSVEEPASLSVPPEPSREELSKVTDERKEPVKSEDLSSQMRGLNLSSGSSMQSPSKLPPLLPTLTRQSDDATTVKEKRKKERREKKRSKEALAE